MTVVAWDGRFLAADKQSNFGNTTRTVTKVYRLDDRRAVGFSGDASVAMLMLHWFRSGMEREKYPECQRDKDNYATCVLITIINDVGDCMVEEFSRTPHAEVIEDRFYALGSGRDFALAAMHCGRDAVAAVKLASQLDQNCGKGVDWIDLKPEHDMT